MRASIHGERSRRGGSLVEFAVCLPLLLYLTLAAVDFGRFYVEVARVEAEAQAAARGAASGFPPGTGELFAECPGSPAAPEPNLSEICPDGAPARIYYRGRAEQRFEMLGRYPGFPAETTIRRVAIQRTR